MSSARSRLMITVVFAAAIASPLSFTVAESAEGSHGEPVVEFARDVLPILSANCFSCHGPDEGHRQADLRLDLEGAAKDARGGIAAVVAGDPDASHLIARLTSNDPGEVMPPPEFNRQVEPSQIETIRRWIAQGAKWQRHWAFEPVIRPAGDIDSLVRERLSASGLSMRPAAPPATLARRLSLDLIGLPPTTEMVDAFTVALQGAPGDYEQAYESLVDELLRRPEFGEHWARMWLDLARYADTKGYEKDRGRTMWPYRDWVIDAFNTDMPLDQFTLEQLAGDLLPEPSQQQIIATAFHRNTMANDEGGTDDEEFRVAAVKDRINTTVQVWMGLTMGCAQCHTHKYDPISIDEYYRFFAIFNQTEDADRYDDSPRMEIVSDQQKAERDRIASDLSRLKEELTLAQEQAGWSAESGETLWVASEVVELTSVGGATLTPDDDHSIAVSGATPPEDTYEVTLRLEPGRYTAIRLEALPWRSSDGDEPAKIRSVGRNPRDPNFVVSEFVVRLPSRTEDEPLELTNPRADFAQGGWPVEAAIDGDSKTGWAIGPQKEERHVAIFDLQEPLELVEEGDVRVSIVQNFGDGLTMARFRLSVSEADVTRLQTTAESTETERLRGGIAATEKDLADLEARIVQLPILRELAEDKRRQSRVHNRGNFLEPGDAVEPSVLASFHPLDESASPDRIGAARWLVDPANPLTPRVWANRVWGRLFGRGLVETEEDFGTLGALPTNPELLDWLAAEYRDGGWSHKRLLRMIVMSETYRQSSYVDDEIRRIDPDNRLMSRGARYRLSGEALRDQALAVSGLLSSKMGGPPVMPPQPDGLWRSTYSGEQWIDAEGEDRFRRAIYTFLKRTTPYPSLIAFDGGSGEVCLIRRIPTNTPLQALVTLNDPVFIEAAAALAARMIKESPAADDLSRAEHGLWLALRRPARDGEAEPLARLRQELVVAFQAEPAKADSLISLGRVAMPEADPSELASWIVVGSAIMNLDEFLTRN